MAKKKKKRKLTKSQVLKTLKNLYEEDATVEKIDSTLHRFVVEKAPLKEVLLDELQKNDNDFNLFVSHCIQTIDDPSVMDDLEDIFLENDGLTDHTRAVILSILTAFGVNTTLDEYFNRFDDLGKLLEDSLTRTLKGIEEDEQNIVDHIELIDQMEEHAQIAYVINVAERLGSPSNGGYGAFELLKHISWSDKEKLAGECIRSISRLGTNDSVEAILQLANYHQSPNTRAIARGFIHSEKPLTQITPKSTSVAKLGTHYRSVLSVIDGMGSRVLWIVRKVGRQYNAVNFVLNLKVGVKDSFGLIGVRKSEIDSIIEEFEENLYAIDIDYDYAKLIFSEAMAKNGEHTPSVIHFWRHHAFELPLYPKELNFAFDDEVDWNYLRDNDELFSYTDIVVDDPEVIGWFIHNEEAYDFVEKYYDVLEDCDKEDLEYVEMLKDAEKNLFLPEKEFFQDLLLKAAELKHLQGQDEERDLMLSAHTHLAESEKDLISQPFVKEVIELTIENVYENMENGYDLRKNPNDFDY